VRFVGRSEPSLSFSTNPSSEAYSLGFLFLDLSLVRAMTESKEEADEESSGTGHGTQLFSRNFRYSRVVDCARLQKAAIAIGFKTSLGSGVIQF
jgi:hypothetical protein